MDTLSYPLNHILVILFSSKRSRCGEGPLVTTDVSHCVNCTKCQVRDHRSVCPRFFVDILGQKQPIYNDDDQLIINIMIVNYDLKSCFVK